MITTRRTVLMLVPATLGVSVKTNPYGSVAVPLSVPRVTSSDAEGAMEPEEALKLLVMFAAEMVVCVVVVVEEAPLEKFLKSSVLNWRNMLLMAFTSKGT